MATYDQRKQYVAQQNNAARDLIINGESADFQYEYCVVDFHRDPDISSFYFSAEVTGPDGVYTVARSEKFRASLFKMALSFRFGPDQNDEKVRNALNIILQKLRAEGWTDAGEKADPCFGGGTAWWYHKLQRKI